MQPHDYLRHTLDCLEEAQTALHLAQRKGQIEPGKEATVRERLDTLTRDLDRIRPAH